MPDTVATKKIASLELARVLAIFAIIGLHCQMAMSYFQFNEIPWVGYIINQLARFAVPLFFLLSGYFIQPKLSAQPLNTLKHYAQPIAKVWLVWSIICLLVPFNALNVAQHGYLGERQGYWGYLMSAPLNSALEGGLVHLWFLPALVIAVAILASLIHLKQTKLMLPLAIMLYVYGVLAGSYQDLTQLWTPFFTRNGPFFSTLMVLIGFMFREHKFTVSAAQAVALMLTGMGLHFAEAYWLMGYDVPFNGHDFLFGTGLWGAGVFLWFLSKPTLGNHPWVFAISKSMLGIYVSHLLIVIMMMNVTGFLQLTDLPKDIVVYIGALIVTFLLVKGLERTPLSKVLFR